MKIDRRRFGAMLLGGSSALLASCGGEDRRTAVDHENLARQRSEEEARGGSRAIWKTSLRGIPRSLPASVVRT